MSEFVVRNRIGIVYGPTSDELEARDVAMEWNERYQTDEYRVQEWVVEVQS